MPTETQLRAYINEMPVIYKDILASFPYVEPSRKAGYGLAFQSILVYLSRTGKSFELGDIITACDLLKEQGILEIKNRIFAHPTEIGEQLISLITDQPLAAKQLIPALPARTW